jgi:hypothetical protein
MDGSVWRIRAIRAAILAAIVALILTIFGGWSWWLGVAEVVIFGTIALVSAALWRREARS